MIMRIDKTRTSSVAATVSGTESIVHLHQTCCKRRYTDTSWDWLKAKADEKLRATQSKPVEIAFLQELSNFLDKP